MKYTIVEANDDQIKYISDSLAAFNRKIIGIKKPVSLKFFYQQDQQIIGGIEGVVSRQWLMLKTWFVKPNQRHQGIGLILLQTILNEAVKHDMQYVSIETPSVDTAALLKRCGFINDGTLQNRPPNHATYYLYAKKTMLNLSNLTTNQLIVSDIDDHTYQAYLNAIEADKKSTYGDWQFTPINFIAMDEEAHILGGWLGYIGWQWMYCDTLWVSEEVRHQGIGYALMKKAEEYAKKQGINQAYLGTSSFQAPGFYRKLGYEIFFVRKDAPPGYKGYYLFKELG